MTTTKAWCVYEDATGQVFKVDPPTKTTAEREARLAGQGHRAMRDYKATELANAFAHGRMYGLVQGLREPHNLSTTEGE